MAFWGFPEFPGCGRVHELCRRQQGQGLKLRLTALLIFVRDESAVLRTHPMLVAAIKELDKILEAKSSKENISAEILNEIELLEEDIAIRSECLKVLVQKIPAID